MTMNFDIMYLIYFQIDDYETLCNFLVLNKEFYKNFTNYNKIYKHKFNVLSYKVFNILEEFCKDDTFCNENFFNGIEKKSFIFIFNLYKKFFFKEFEKNWTERYIKKNGQHMCNNLLITKAYNTVNVKINNNKIKLKNPNKNLLYNTAASLPFLFLQKKFNYLDLLLKKE